MCRLSDVWYCKGIEVRALALVAGYKYIVSTAVQVNYIFPSNPLPRFDVVQCLH
jgi:hypothetical protein